MDLFDERILAVLSEAKPKFSAQLPFHIAQSPATSIRCPIRPVDNDCGVAFQSPKARLQVRERRILQTDQKKLQRWKLPSNPEKQIIKIIFGQFRNNHERSAG